ncbi:MAG: NnrU family protein [Pseudotabrizicola sp.]|uniref:NnrU family protein n=1 Tax=Pseudotabrizicola sp. TaxID=2939647 RepID=UPI00271FB762|nr:NnrU family protein [Pseudotabrizicola sp.]MDO8881581.1 NnrU family protein [Pseudotabrizicola sp.]MDP2079973.1 NnrU family protein [Pseudotabrizicola sp.]MDZ7575417.1 NnrU family protein [Pseudotabrizicola sp.]
MTFLILGVALWWAAHFFKRVAPDVRAGMGEAGKGLVTGLLIVSIGLMYWGYGQAAGPVWWGRSAALVGINNLLMVLAIYFYAVSGSKTWLARKVRHPQLTGFKLWAVAHLLVNGDLRGFILFGGLLAWAVVSVIVINRAQPEWVPPAPRPVAKEFVAIAATVVVTVVVMLLHNWLGVRPWG